MIAVKTVEYKPRQWHWFGDKLRDKFTTWNDLLASESFKDFRSRKLSEYNLEFVRQGFFQESLHTVSNEALFPFGAHKGKPIASVPKNYLEWVLRQDWLEKWGNLESLVNQVLDDLDSDRATPDDIKNILTLD